MDLDELTRLCDQLSAAVSLGPGLHNAIFAMQDAREAIESLRREIPATDIRTALAEIETAFEQWFTASDWRGHDQGQSFQQQLYARIFRLKMGIRLWHSALLSAPFHKKPDRS